MTIWKDIPPLAALRAFAAYAEAGTLAGAGARIGTTHAAVSQQIRALESHLGLALVRRGGRALEFTPEGRQLADAVQAGFGAIARTLRDLTEAEAERPLRITATPAFAAGWLMPRLADFRARHPGVDLVIDPTPDLRPLGPEGADAAFRYGGGRWPGVQARLLLRSPVAVVAAPALIGARRVAGLADLADLPWLQELGTTEATGLFERHGVARAPKAGMTTLPGNLILDAVRDGQGVAAIARVFVEADLAAGRLRLLFEDRVGQGYHLVTRPGRLRGPLDAFVRWTLRQAGGIRR